MIESSYTAQSFNSRLREEATRMSLSKPPNSARFNSRLREEATIGPRRARAARKFQLTPP